MQHSYITAAIIFLLASILAMSRNRRTIVAVSLLIVSVALNHYRLDLASAGIRIEHLALLVVGVYAAARFIQTKTLPELKFEDAFLALFFFFLVISSLLNAPSFRESLKYIFIMMAATGIYFLTRTLVDDVRLFHNATIVLLCTGTAAGLFGIVAWILYPFNINIGVLLYPISSLSGLGYGMCTFSPYGSLFESNIFGSYETSVAMILLSLLSFGAIQYKRVFLIAIVICVAAIGLSLTRGAWGALGVGLLLMVALSENRRRAAVVTASALLILIPVIVLASNTFLDCRLLITAGKREYVPAKAAKLTTTPEIRMEAITMDRVMSTYTSIGRFYTIRKALNDWSQHPFLGNGANSFGQKYINTSSEKAWIANITIMTLHDTGIIGILLLFAAFLFVARDVWLALKKYQQRDFLRYAIVAYTISFIALMAAFQFTTAFWLGYTWVHLGLLRAGTLIALRNSKP